MQKRTQVRFLCGSQGMWRFQGTGAPFLVTKGFSNELPEVTDWQQFHWTSSNAWCRGKCCRQNRCKIRPSCGFYKSSASLGVQSEFSTAFTNYPSILE